jgi:nicotinate-nucleotide adenylyltransferase
LCKKGLGDYLNTLQSMMKKIGLYGGSFDPIHFGHLNLAIEMVEKQGLDEVWFCPAYVNPHKLKSTPHASPQQRLKMLELALAACPSFRIIDSEIGRSGPSYTLDTLHLLLAENSRLKQEHQFFLILGEDSVPGFFHWFKPEEIVQLAPVLVGSRALSINPSLLQGHNLICEAFKKGWTKTRVMEISSTEVRERLKNRQYCGHLVPSETLCYIYKNELYFNLGNSS